MKTITLILLAFSIVSCSTVDNPVEPAEPAWTETTNLYISITEDAALGFTNLDVFLNFTPEYPSAIKLQVGERSFVSDAIIVVNPFRDSKYYLCRFLLDKTITGNIRVFVRH